MLTIHNVTDRLAQPKNKLFQTEDKLNPMHTRGTYRIPWECGKGYIGMTSRTVKTRITKHRRTLGLHQPDKSAVAQNPIYEGHNSHFGDPKALVRPSCYYNLVRREVLQIEQHPDNINRDDSLKVSIW